MCVTCSPLLRHNESNQDDTYIHIYIYIYIGAWEFILLPWGFMGQPKVRREKTLAWGQPRNNPSPNPCYLALGVAVRPPPLWWAPLILHTLALPLRPLAYTNLCTVAAGFVPPSPIPCSLALPPPLGLPSAPFPRDGGQGVEPVCMQSVGSVQAAQVFFLKVRRRQSSKSVECVRS